MIYLFNLFH